jgi:hypothetical protein
VLQPVKGTRGLLDIIGDLGGDLNNFLGWMGGNRGAEFDGSRPVKTISALMTSRRYRL